MKDRYPIFPSILAGAISGAIVAVLMIQNQDAFPRTSNPDSAPVSGFSEQTASDYEKTVIQTVQQAQEAVVSIVISKDVPIFEQIFPRGFNPLDDFLNGNGFSFRFPSIQQRGTERREIGGGSGFLVSADGMIVTNRHVVNQEDAEYTVFLNDGSKHEAKVVARDPVNDIAILQIDGNNLPFLSFADSDSLQVGQSVIAIGNSLGEFRNTVSTGIISGLSRSIVAGDNLGQSEQLNEVIQTDAAINPGNSGGPLLNLNGRVVGVNVAIVQGSQNIGFALPANAVQTVVESVQKTGTIVRAQLGVRYVAVTPAIQKANNLSVDYGALVLRGENPEELAVIPGSPANKAGIVEGDIILEIDGMKIDESRSLASMIGNKKPGDTVSLNVLSKGEEKTIQVKLEELKN